MSAPLRYCDIPPLPEQQKAQILDWIYHFPDGISDQDEWLKANHKDLDEMTLAELQADLRRLQLRLLLTDEELYADDWLLQRLEALEREIRARR